MDRNSHNHCCQEHGCKFNDRHCPVVAGKTEQKNPCDQCEPISYEDYKRVKKEGVVLPGDCQFNNFYTCPECNKGIRLMDNFCSHCGVVLNWKNFDRVEFS
jgi:hypothetical protein